MNIVLKIVCCTVLSLFTFQIGVTQSFEGNLTLRATTAQGETFSLLTVKGSKTLRVIRSDSVESIVLIKDWSAGTSTLLRSRGDMKYGFKAPTVENSNPPQPDANAAVSHVMKESTGKTERVGTTICTKIIFKSQYATAEAWVAQDLNMSLSKYFPEFLGPKTDPHLYDLRKEADKEGLVMKYSEKLNDPMKENNFELFIKEKEIAEAVFNATSEYIILDEADTKRLSIEAESNPKAKKQWDDYTRLFGIR